MFLSLIISSFLFNILETIFLEPLCVELFSSISLIDKFLFFFILLSWKFASCLSSWNSWDLVRIAVVYTESCNALDSNVDN